MYRTSILLVITYRDYAASRASGCVFDKEVVQLCWTQPDGHHDWAQAEAGGQASKVVMAIIHVAVCDLHSRNCFGARVVAGREHCPWRPIANTVVYVGGNAVGRQCYATANVLQLTKITRSYV